MRSFSLFIRCTLLSTCVVLFGLSSCSSIKLLLQGGEKQVKREPRPSEPGPYILIFAFDGVGYDQLMEAIHSGKAPAMAGMLGREEGYGLYEHAYSVPNAVSILPSTTIAAWSSIFTGAPTAWNGVAGNEWFVREDMKFFAPVPVSVQEMDDNRAMVTEGLVSKALKSPTLFQQAGVKSAVSLNPVYRGADYFTLVDPVSMVALYTEFLAHPGGENSPEKVDIYEKLDKESVPKLLDSIEDHGVPKIQVVYFPGIDLYTHLARDPIPMEVNYLETVTDPLVAQILEAYRGYGVLDQTYVVVIADHGHTPVLKDPQHALGTDPNGGPAAAVKAAGFRPRKFVLNPGASEQDYQAVFAYQGAIAYVYLADRSTCPKAGMTCDWKRPPRYTEDVLPAVRAFYNSNKTGKPIPVLKNTLDLIFTRRPTRPGKNTQEYEIFDGHRLVPIWKYLIRHPRPDLIQLDKRMEWLSMGPYGNRSGDILLLTRSGLNRPIEKRYYFSAPYYSWHGSASPQDSHIPLVVARKDFPGTKLKKMVNNVAGLQPSQLALVPLVRALLTSELAPGPGLPIVNRGSDESAAPVAKSPSSSSPSRPTSGVNEPAAAATSNRPRKPLGWATR
jgi:Type I phosphodiesterase / nucleotide pyrophosphatase